MVGNVVGSAYDDCFVDRQDVLDILESLADSAEKEERPRYAFVYGRQGIGKTETIRHFLMLQDSKSGRQNVIRVTGNEIKGPPLLPFAQGISEFQKSQGKARTIAHLAFNFVGCVPEIGPYLKDAAYAVMAPRMSEMDRMMTGELEMFTFCSRIVESASRNKLLIFCVDDAQWLDETALSLLSHIVQTNTQTPILFIIAVRKIDDDQNQSLGQLEAIQQRVWERAKRIDVEPLTLDSCAEVMRRFSGDRSDDKHIHELYRVTEGNPYLLRHAMSSYTLGTYPVAFPKPDQSMESAYVDLPESKKVLRYAAVLGLRFELSTLSKILKMEPSKVFDILSDVDKKYGLVKNPGNGEYFEFSHQIARDSVYKSMKPIRAACHMEVAEFLESEDPKVQSHYLIAYHYLKTPRKDLALRHMRSAALASMSGNLFTDASEWLRQCLNLAEDLDIGREQISAMRADYARSLLEENKVEPSQKILEDLIRDNCLSLERRAHVHILLSRCHRLLGTAESGQKALSHARIASSVAEAGDPRQAGDAYAYLATVCDHFGDSDLEVEQAYRKATKCYQGYPLELARLYRKCGMVMESRQAIGKMRRSLLVFELNRMDIEAARCLNNIGAECLYVGRFEESHERLSASLEKFRMLGAHEVDIPLNNLGLFYLQRGDYLRAMRHFEDALARQSERYNEIAITVNISTVYRKSGNLRKAADSLYKIEELVIENAETTLRDYYGFNRSAVHRDLGEWDAAKEWLLKFPPNTYKNDQKLAWAKRTRAMSEICELKGVPGISAGDATKMRDIFSTQRPQRWFYDIDYYPCDIHVWD